MPCIISTQNWMYFLLVFETFLLIGCLWSIAACFLWPRMVDAASVIGPICAVLFVMLIFPLYNQYDDLSIYYNSPESVYCEQTKVKFQ